MIVLVCGATIGQSPEQNLDQIEDGIRAILPAAEAAGIRLAIEPLHPMYAGDRSAVASLRDANLLAAAHQSSARRHRAWIPSMSGGKPTSKQEIQTCAHNGHLFAFHICEFKPDFDHPLLDRGLPGEGVNATPRILGDDPRNQLHRPHRSRNLLPQILGHESARLPGENPHIHQGSLDCSWLRFLVPGYWFLVPVKIIYMHPFLPSS